jgi:TatD DNase family protein
MNFIDAHLHLQDSRIEPDSAGVMQRAVEAGVVQLFCNATSESDWDQVYDLASAHRQIVPFMGIHPWFIGSTDEGWQQRLEELLLKTGGGIGEAGLDKFCKTDSKLQEEIFIDQLQLSRQLQRPIAIHCIGRWGRLLELLNEYQPELPLIHSFNGSLEIMYRLVDIGAYLSFSTMLAQPEKEKSREVFKKTPLDHILLETDSPDQFCPALLNRTDTTSNRINEPCFVAELYSFAADLREMKLETFTETLYNNGQIFTHRASSRQGSL